MESEEEQPEINLENLGDEHPEGVAPEEHEELEPGELTEEGERTDSEEEDIPENLQEETLANGETRLRGSRRQLYIVVDDTANEPDDDSQGALQTSGPPRTKRRRNGSPKTADAGTGNQLTSKAQSQHRPKNGRTS